MPQVIIEVAVSGETPRQVLLDKSDIVIGRSAEADVFLDGTQVSRVHCKLTHSGGKWRLVDCNSSNGVYLDRGARGAPFLARSDIVVSGDALYIGRYKILVRMPQDGAPLPRSLSALSAVQEGDARLVQTEQTVMVRRATMKEDMRQWLMDDPRPAENAHLKEPSEG